MIGSKDRETLDFLQEVSLERFPREALSHLHERAKDIMNLIESPEKKTLDDLSPMNKRLFEKIEYTDEDVDNYLHENKSTYKIKRRG